MKQHQLTYIEVIAQEGNLTKAAQKLFMSQPALTIFLNKLEQQLGVKLFDRSHSPISLTFAGKIYLEETRKIIQLEERLHRQLKEISLNQRGHLRVGIGNARGTYWLPFIMPEFKKDYPNIDIHIFEGKGSEFEEWLLTGKIDLAITALPIFSLNLAYEFISEETIFLAINQGNPILRGMDLTGNGLHHLLKIDAHLLNGQKFFCPSRGHGLYHCTMQIFERHGICPGEIEEINNSDTAYHLACAGFGLVFTPDSSATPPYPPKLPVFCTVDDPPCTRKIVVAYPKDTGCSVIARKFIDVTKRVVQSCPSLQIP